MVSTSGFPLVQLQGWFNHSDHPLPTLKNSCVLPVPSPPPHDPNRHSRTVTPEDPSRPTGPGASVVVLFGADRAQRRDDDSHGRDLRRSTRGSRCSARMAARTARWKKKGSEKGNLCELKTRSTAYRLKWLNQKATT